MGADSQDQPKKSNGPLIGIVAAVVLAIGGFAYYHYAAHPRNSIETLDQASSQPSYAVVANVSPQQVRAYFNEGQLAKALQAATAIQQKAPKSADGFALQQEALARLDKYEAARQMYKAAISAGVDKSAAVHAEELLVSRLLNDPAGEAAQVQWAGSSDDGYLVAIAHAYALEDAGQFNAANTAWQSGALKARQAGAKAVAAAALADDALANALTNSCGTVSGQANAAMSLDASAKTAAAAGIAMGLCRLNGASEVAANIAQNHNDDPLASALYVPEIKAAEAIGVGKGDDALEALHGVAQYDLGSLAPYLRGLADLETKQPKLAVGDFQNIINHRGAFVAGRLLCYPMALEQLGKTYNAMGDKVNAAKVLERFHEYWRGADRSAGAP
jgi:tetratricopeptide (TPR) repeat protein